ncbi:hypothetical protein ACWGIU_17090 [Streptomyces sp. NPDC054840]
MRPEGRNVSSPVRRSWWSTRLVAGGLTSLAAVSLVSAMSVAPAAAQGLNAEPTSAVAFSLPSADSATGTDRDKDKDHDRPNPPPGVDGCFEIDTVRQEAAGGGMAFYSAVSDGSVYVGDEQAALSAIDWFDISDQGGDEPVNPCGTSIDVGPLGEADGSEIVVDVITTAGTVHTIICERTGPVIDSCGQWEQRDTPTPGDVLEP